MAVRDPFPFFTGCQRSGTTLVRVIFNAHPELAIPPESHFIPDLVARRHRYERAGTVDAARLLRDLAHHDRYRRWRLPEDAARVALREPEPAADLPEAIRRLYAAWATRQGKRMFGDKTPRYAVRIPQLADLFPESRFVHVIRDGRDVALSVLEVPWGPSRIDRAALYWRERVIAARDAGRALGPDRYLAYHHEELVEDPEGVVRRICGFLDLTFDDAMLRYHEHRKPMRGAHMQHLTKPPTKGLRDWRTQMAPRDVRIFELLAGDLLAELGYETVTDERTLGPALEAQVQRRARRLAQMHALKTSPSSRRLLDGPAGRVALRAYATARRVVSRAPDSP